MKERAVSRDDDAVWVRWLCVTCHDEPRMYLKAVKKFKFWDFVLETFHRIKSSDASWQLVPNKWANYSEIVIHDLQSCVGYNQGKISGWSSVDLMGLHIVSGLGSVVGIRLQHLGHHACPRYELSCQLLRWLDMLCFGASEDNTSCVEIFHGRLCPRNQLWGVSKFYKVTEGYPCRVPILVYPEALP